MSAKSTMRAALDLLAAGPGVVALRAEVAMWKSVARAAGDEVNELRTENLALRRRIKELEAR